MDGKGQEGTYNFLSRRLGRATGGTGHRAQRGSCPPATPLAPPMVSTEFTRLTEISIQFQSWDTLL